MPERRGWGLRRQQRSRCLEQALGGSCGLQRSRHACAPQQQLMLLRRLLLRRGLSELPPASRGAEQRCPL